MVIRLVMRWLAVVMIIVPAAACTAVASGADAARPGALDPLPVESVVVDGIRRLVRFHIPERLADSPAIVVALHGSGGDGARFRQLTGGAFDRLADQHGFVLAYPDAIGGHWHDCRARAPYQTALAGIDDVAFLTAVVERGRAHAGGAVSGAVVVGYSNGGHLVFRLAWEASEEYAAFAAIGAHLPAAGERACASHGAPVSVFLTSGTDDPINPWAGGAVEVPGAGSPGQVLSAEATAGYFRDLARLPAEPSVVWQADGDELDGTSVETRRWSVGRGPEVVLMAVHGGGHSFPLPGAMFPSEIVGRTSRDLDGAAAIWSFFSRQLHEPTQGGENAGDNRQRVPSPIRSPRD